MKSDEVKKIVKEKYSEIALQIGATDGTACCGPSGCCSGDDEYVNFSENYQNLDGYNPDADMGLGCGLPTEYALIKKGDTVIDLGSGAGNDCFVARALTGETGKVIGIDMTEAMIEKARLNAEKLGYKNVEFLLGDIEDLTIPYNTADVVISNCVLNMVFEKEKAFSEIFRILKPGGHLSVSDIVLRGNLPLKIQQATEMYAGCVSGAVEIEEYLNIMRKIGLVNITLQEIKVIKVPDEILLKYINNSELTELKKTGTGIYSITVYAERPN